MVKEVNVKNHHLFACEECGFAYIDEETAEECEAFCKSHKACSLEITAYAITSIKI